MPPTQGNVDVPPDDEAAEKPLLPFKNGKQRALMESSKLDNQQKVILKCASKTIIFGPSVVQLRERL